MERIELAKFINPAGLRRIGNNLYLQTDASGEPLIDNPGNQGLGTLLTSEEAQSIALRELKSQFRGKG